jgi:hypothetical protein
MDIQGYTQKYSKDVSTLTQEEKSAKIETILQSIERDRKNDTKYSF